MRSKLKKTPACWAEARRTGCASMGHNRFAVLVGANKGVDCILVLRVRYAEQLSELFSLTSIVEDSFYVACVDALELLGNYVLHGVCDV